MERRKLLVLLGAITATWPLAARPTAAQNSARLSRVGFLGAGAPVEAHVAAFRDRLRELGYVEGRSLAIEFRWGHGTFERLPNFAEELVRMRCDVIVAWTSPAVVAARNASGNVPIVMLGVSDPIGMGFIKTLARPGGTITGVTNLARDLSSKLVQVLMEVAPATLTVFALRNVANPSSGLLLNETEAGAHAAGVQIDAIDVASPGDLAPAFARMAAVPAAGVVVLPDPLFVAESRQIGELAARHRVPSVFARRESVEAGGLASYGSSLRDSFRDAATYVHRILNGANPAEMPVEQPTRVELVINLKAAAALGVAIAPALLARADEVIE